jgi:hypothetical protein
MPIGSVTATRAEPPTPAGESAVRDFYARSMRALNAAGVSYLVGGGYALGHYTGVARDMKDFDIFVRRDDYDTTMEVLRTIGCETQLTFPHWLGKASCAHGYVDVIFNSGNGVAAVDADWFRFAPRAEVCGEPVLLCPAEEMIWSKASIMERERFDGADIMHLMLTRSAQLDWKRLLLRFGNHWRVLLAHLCLFGYVYPSERARIPQWLLRGLLARADEETRHPAPTAKVCQGTLLSREQYLVDVQAWGFTDVRQTPASSMSDADIERWTCAISESGD